MTRLGMYGIERRTTEVKMPFSSHRITDTHHQHDLPVLMLTLGTWLTQCSTLSPFPLPHCLEGWHCGPPRLKSGEIHSPSFGVKRFQKLFGISLPEKFLSSSLLGHLFIRMDSWIFISRFALHPTTILFIYCSGSNCSSCGHWGCF